MRRTTVDGHLAYKRIDPVPVWEAQQVEQPSLFG